MRFRLHSGNLHVHHCTEHEQACDFFDHAPAWLFTNRDAAKTQLLVYRRSVVARITSLTVILEGIDAMLHRLDLIRI